MKTTELDPSALYWASFNRFELRVPGQAVMDCAHQGECGSDVAAWIDRIKAQVEADNFPNKPTAEKGGRVLARGWHSKH